MAARSLVASTGYYSIELNKRAHFPRSLKEVLAYKMYYSDQTGEDIRNVAFMQIRKCKPRFTNQTDKDW